MFNDENKSSSLAKFLNSFDYVIVDTCSLMEDSFPAWMDILVNAKEYLREDLHIQIPNKCVDELKKHSKNREDDSARIAAKRALKILRQVKRKKIFELTKKEKDQNFADNVIYTTVSNLRIRYKVLILTQDKGLAEDLRRLNLLDSQRGRKVATYKLMPDGTLDVNFGQADHFHQNHKSPDEGETKLAPKPFFPSPLKDDEEDLLTKVIANDKKLRSDLNNTNYPKENKLKDIDAQLSMIMKLPEEKKTTLKLLLNDSALHEEKTKLLNAKVQAAPLSPVKPQIEISPEPLKPVESPKLFPSFNKPVEKRLWFGEGRTIEFALDQCAQHYGLLFRDHTIPYVPGVHGPTDLTDLDRHTVVSALLSDKAEILYKGSFYKAEKNAMGYKVYIDIHPAPHVEEKAPEKIQPIVSTTPVVHVTVTPTHEAPKPVITAPATSVETIKPMTLGTLKPTTLKKEPVHRRAPSVSITKPASPSTPVAAHGATLIVAVPDDDDKREYIERKSRRDAEGKEQSKPTSFKKKMNQVPAPKKSPLPVTNKKSDIKVDRTTSGSIMKPKTGPGPRPAERPAKPVKAPQPKIVAPKPIVPAQPKQQVQIAPKVVAGVDSPLVVAQKAEKRLMANINNPNYPKENKAKDIEAQLQLLGKLKPEEAKTLRYRPDSLKSMLSLLK